MTRREATLAGVRKALPPFHIERATAKYGSLHTVKDLFAPAAKLVGVQDGDERIALIVGSGPSLIDFDWTQLDRRDLYSFCINDKGHQFRDKFTPSCWVFYDTGVMKRYAGHSVDPSTKIVTRAPMIQNAMVSACPPSFPLPDWIHRIHTFSATKHFRLDGDQLYMNRTTSVAALCLAIKMGFRKIVLMGQDLFCTNNNYYDTEARSKQRGNRRQRNAIGDGRYCEDRHVLMVQDFTKIAATVERWRWQGRIIQTSLHSPLSCFEKMTWCQAIQQLRQGGQPDYFKMRRL